MTTMRYTPQFLIDGNGEKTAVLLPIEQYERIMQRFEEMARRLGITEDVEVNDSVRETVMNSVEQSLDDHAEIWKQLA